MATYNYLAQAYADYAPGGPPGAHAEFPFDWNCVEDCTANVTWFQPWVTTHALCHGMHWVLKNLAVSFSIDWDTIHSASAGGYLLRYYTDHSVGTPHPVIDEHDLKWPGISETDGYGSADASPTMYYGVVNGDGWDGVGSTLDLTLTIHVMSKLIIESQDIPHFTWQADGLALQPSFWITGNLIITTGGGGSEYSFNFTNSPLGTDNPVSISFLSGNGGGSVNVSFHGSDSYDSFSLAITVGDTFDWAP